jgi:16S rRNA (guanine527-N7)-methyltransferase
MDPAQIAPLLAPFLEHDALSPAQLSDISTYIDLLLRWNARLNLTSVRRPEDIVTRHFGESFFAARHLFPLSPAPEIVTVTPTLADLGSGAGFPGIPIKLWAPHVHVTLIESHQKKATFLREVIRATKLTNIDVVSTRVTMDARAACPGESEATEGSSPVQPPSEKSRVRFSSPPPTTAWHTVTLRAVERFAEILPLAAALLHPSGRLALLIGEEQLPGAQTLLPAFTWPPPLRLPGSRHRVLSIAQAPPHRSDSPVV